MRRVALLLAVASMAIAQEAKAPAGTTCKPGDSILLDVRNETALSDTFVVSNALAIALPGIGEVSVAGVPRDSLTPHFAKVLSKYLRHVDVSAKAMVRIGVIGEVARPGFYAVPVDVLFADALMAAGGPTKDAKVQELYVERAGKKVFGPERLHAALQRNSTVDEVALQSGDMVNIPRAKTGLDTEAWVRIAAAVVTIPLAIVTLTRMR